MYKSAPFTASATPHDTRRIKQFFAYTNIDDRECGEKTAIKENKKTGDELSKKKKENIHTIFVKNNSRRSCI